MRKTAGQLAGVAMEFDDLCQLLRIKVWRALESYDPARCKSTRDRYVFVCVRNLVKDILKVDSRHPLPMFIEDIAAPHPEAGAHAQNNGQRDAFEMRYMAQRHDETYGRIEDGPPLIPSTLSVNERKVVALLYYEYEQREIADIIGISESTVNRAVRSIREKMADWAPGAEVPMPVAA